MTKRLFAYLGLSMLVVLTVVYYLGLTGVILSFGAAAAMAVCAFFVGRFRRNRSELVFMAIVVVVSVGLFDAYSYCFFSAAKPFDSTTAEVKAVVNDIPFERKGLYFYELGSSEIDGKDRSLNIILRSERKLYLDYGDIISCKLDLKQTDNDYNIAKKISLNANLQGEPSEIKRLGRDNGIRFFPIFIREKLTDAVYSLMPEEEASLCCAVILGEKYLLSDDLYSSFSETGLTYLIVVSGMHMSIVVGTFLFLLRFFDNRMRFVIVRFVVSVLVVLLYMAVTGYYPSVIRSGVSVIMIMMGFCFRRRTDSFNNLGMAAFLICVFNPLCVGNIGVLMSFGTVAGIVYLTPRIMKPFYEWYRAIRKELRDELKRHRRTAPDYKRIKAKINFKLFLTKLLYRLYQYAVISVSAFLSVTPITLLFFGSMTPFVALSSVLVAPVVFLLLVFGLISSVLFYVPFLSVVASVLAFVSQMLARCVLLVLKLFASIPGSRVYINPDFSAVWLLIFFSLIGLVMFFKKKKRKLIITVAFCAVLLVVETAGHIIYEKNTVSLRVLNSGDGILAVFRGSDKSSVLSCGGSYSRRGELLKELDYTVGRLDHVVVSSNRPFSAMLKDNLINEFDVDDILLYYRSRKNGELYFKCPEKCRVYLDNTRLVLPLCEGVSDTLICSEGLTWQYISSDGVSALIAPEADDIEGLPTEFRNPDYLITGVDGDYLNHINCKTIIWASTKSPPKTDAEVKLTSNGTISIDLQ